MFDYTKDLKRFPSFLSEPWEVQSMVAAPVYIEAGPISGILGMAKALGYHYNRFIMRYEGTLLHMYYHLDDIHAAASELLARYRKDPGYLSTLEAYALPRVAAMEKAGLDLSRLPKMTFPSLVGEYRKLLSLFHDFFPTSHVLEAVSMTFDRPLRERLSAELSSLGREEETTAVFGALTAPGRMPFVIAVQNSLAALYRLSEGKDLAHPDKTLLAAIDDHVSRFYWAKITWWGGDRLEQEDVLSELRSYREHGGAPAIIAPERFLENSHERKRLLSTLHLSRELSELVAITVFCSSWQDDRKIQMLKGMYVLEHYIKAIAAKIGIEYTLLKYLLFDEVALLIERSPEELTRMLAPRTEKFAILHDGATALVLSGSAYDTFFSQKTSPAEGLVELSGLTASPGIAEGIVRICLQPHRLKNVKEGDILVTSMTRPEYVPALRRCAAVVTDEGGITCHAAVISRELGIPCVIGTKVATKLLKDGMRVQVNANHGMVRQL